MFYTLVCLYVGLFTCICPLLITISDRYSEQKMIKNGYMKSTLTYITIISQNLIDTLTSTITSFKDNILQL